MNYSYKEEIKKLNIDNDKILILYKVEKGVDYQKIKLFGKKFVENNKDICKLIIKSKEYKLNEYIIIKNIKNTNLIRLKGIIKLNILVICLMNVKNYMEYIIIQYGK